MHFIIFVDGPIWFNCLVYSNQLYINKNIPHDKKTDIINEWIVIANKPYSTNNISSGNISVNY